MSNGRNRGVGDDSGFPGLKDSEFKDLIIVLMQINLNYSVLIYDILLSCGLC